MPLPRTGLTYILKDGSENGGTAADKINDTIQYIEDHPALMRGFVNPDFTNGGLGGLVFANGSPDFLDNEYVIFEQAGYYNFVTGAAVNAGDPDATRIEIGDRYRYDGFAQVWSPVQPPATRNKGWFNPTLPGGGIASPLNIINPNNEYVNGDYLIANESGKYNFNSGFADPIGGEEVKVSDRIAYDGFTWFVLKASLGLMQGWFNPTVDGGGPTLKEAISINNTTYVYGEYIIAEISGLYDFALGQAGTAVGVVVDVGDIYRWDNSNWVKMALSTDAPIYTTGDMFPTAPPPKTGDVHNVLGVERPYIFNGHEWMASTHTYLLGPTDDWNDIKLPIEGDNFIIMESAHTIVEGGYANNTWHLINGRKRFGVVLDGVNNLGACRTLIKDISPIGNTVYDIKVIDTSAAANGSYHSFSLQIKDGEAPIAVMAESNEDNMIFSEIGLGIAGDGSIYVSIILPNASTAGAFLIDISSDTYGDTNSITAGSGTNADSACPMIVIEPPATGSGSAAYIETILPPETGYTYIKEHRYLDGRLEYFIRTDSKKIDNYNNLIGYATYVEIDYLTPFVGDLPFVSITAENHNSNANVWGNVDVNTLTSFRANLLGNDKDYSTGSIMAKVEGRWMV